jgi:hypothetical protein
LLPSPAAGSADKTVLDDISRSLTAKTSQLEMDLIPRQAAAAAALTAAQALEAAMQTEAAALQAVLRIRIHMFLGLSDPDPLVCCMDPDPDPFIVKQKK